MEHSVGFGSFPAYFCETQEYVPASNIIVIQPGSKYLRIGRASDPEPHVNLHAIARRRKTGQSISSDGTNFTKFIHRDTLISLLSGKSAEEKLPPEVESARLQLCHTLQTSLKPDGGQRYITPTEQISAFNKISKVGVICKEDTKVADDILKDLLQKETVVGDDVIKISTVPDYNIHFPWRRGGLNLHSGIGGSLTSVVNDIVDIWEYIIADKLGVSLKDRTHNYRVLLVIPVMFSRLHIGELVHLVMNQLQFSHVIVIHDHVCATFGAALSCATVVDVGDQRISISCVEDGISIPQTRIELKYGGGDLTVALWNLMRQSGVPFKIDLNSLWDLNLLSNLKEELCHFDLSRCGSEEHTVLWDKPGETAVRYNILVGDELLIVPLSYFNPDLLRGSVETTDAISLYKSQQAFDDPFDDAFISETARRVMKDEADDDFIEDIKDVEILKKIDLDQLLGIDQAILHSIECYNGDELKRRFYSCILVVGGGFKFHGLGSWLQNKISLNTPRAYRSDLQEVITSPKDNNDPSTTVWRGAALMVTLDTVAELWISQAEWNTHGSRILREKSLLLWNGTIEAYQALLVEGGGRNWNPSNNGIIFDEEEPLLNTKDSTNNNVNCGYDVSLTFLNNWKTIDSPGFPFDYPSNSHCYYNIYSPEGTKIGLECPDFYVEESYYDCKDKFEWSVSGDWSLWSTQYTCGLGIINQTSISNRISFALHTDTDNRYSQYFYRFRCTVKIISPPSPSKCSCGVSSLENRISPRIVNGETTVQGAYPWRCILRCEVLGDFCGCTIINKDWILTAAHCSNALRSGPGYEVYVNVGDYDIKDPYEADNRIIRIEKIIGHQNYSVITQDNDIALMKLEKSLSFTEPHIQPVCLPFKFRQNGVKNGSSVVAAGWGLDSYGGDQVDKLQEVKLTLLETKYCRSKGHYEARYLTDNMFCTYYEKNGVVRDTCQGDSGGTIDIQDGNRYFALGIVSWGIACAVPDKPGACTNILLYLDWIKDVTKETRAVFCEIN